MSYQSNSFVVRQDKVNLGPGKTLTGIILCIEDGYITITWKDLTTDTISLAAGMSINLRDAAKAVVVSGTYLGS